MREKKKVGKGERGVGCQGRTSIRMYGNVRVCIGYISVAVIKSHFQGDLRKSLFGVLFPEGQSP